MSEENVTEKKIPVKGINCAKCRLDIENVLTRFKGVESAKMDYMTGNISVKYDYKKTDLPEIERVIENLGYNIAYKEYDTGLSKFKKLFGKKIKHLRKVDDHTFPGLVLETCKLTVLLVYEENCGECERIESELNSLIPVFKNKVYFYKADCKLSTICDRYDVKQLPSILFFKDHNLIETVRGHVDIVDVKDRVARLLDDIKFRNG